MSLGQKIYRVCLCNPADLQCPHMASHLNNLFARRLNNVCKEKGLTMKTFHQLNPTEQKKALEVCLNELIRAVCEGAIRFDDKKNKDDLQKRIDRALNKAEKLQTPWFAPEILMEDKKVKEALEGMSRCDAEDAVYPDANVRIIRL